MDPEPEPELDCRYYKSTLPTSEDTVMVKIGTGSEYGYKVTLLEYANVEGFVNLSEIKEKRNKKKKVVKEGEIVPMTVVKVDKEKNHIDLSKRQITPELKEQTTEKYKYSTCLHKLGKELHAIYKDFTKDESVDLEFIMDVTIWRLYDEYTDEPVNKLYIDVLENPKLLFPESGLPNEYVETAIENISNRVIKTDMLKEIDIHLQVTDRDGVKTLKKIFADSKQELAKYKISISVASPPVYTVRVEGPDDKVGTELLRSYVKNIEKAAMDCGAEYRVISDVRSVKECCLDFKF
jgi:translation initiation factor 2 subunit 1